MTFNRLTFGVIAAVVGMAVTGTLVALIANSGGRIKPKLIFLVFAGVTGGVMWLGDYFGLMRDAFQTEQAPSLALDNRRR